MSLCDQCYAPGQCCKRMYLTDGTGDPVVTWADDGPEAARAIMIKKGLPFEPLEAIHPRQDRETGRTYHAWTFSCPKLQADGRCGIYEDRPQLCRRYQPGQDGLCVHFRGAESGDPTSDQEIV